MACYDLKNYNNKVKFYANDLDANAMNWLYKRYYIEKHN